MDTEALSILVNQIERGTNAARAIQEVMSSVEYSPTVWVDGLGYVLDSLNADTKALRRFTDLSRKGAG